MWAGLALAFNIPMIFPRSSADTVMAKLKETEVGLSNLGLKRSYSGLLTVESLVEYFFLFKMRF